MHGQAAGKAQLANLALSGAELPAALDPSSG